MNAVFVLIAACASAIANLPNTAVMNAYAEPVQFVHGKGSLFLTLEQRSAGRPEYEFHIAETILMHPEPETSIVLLRVEGSHLRGTGMASEVLVYRCRRGNLEKVQELSGGERCHIRAIGQQTLEISFPWWARDDPHASPSLTRVVRYRWSRDRATFQKTAARSRAVPFG